MSESCRKLTFSRDKPRMFFTRILEKPPIKEFDGNTLSGDDSEPLAKNDYSTDMTEYTEFESSKHKELIQGLNLALTHLKIINQKVIGKLSPVMISQSEINHIIPRSVRDMVINNITEEDSSEYISLETLRECIHSVKHSIAEESGTKLESESAKPQGSCCKCLLF